MADDIIRSTKDHQVSIPEGSNNAESRKAMVNTGQNQLTADPATGDIAKSGENRQQVVETNPIETGRVRLDEEPGMEDRWVSIPSDRIDDRSILLETDPSTENRVQMPAGSDAVNTAFVPTPSMTDSHASLPPEPVAEPNQVAVPTETITDPSRVILEAGDVVRVPPGPEFPPDEPTVEDLPQEGAATAPEQAALNSEPLAMPVSPPHKADAEAITEVLSPQVAEVFVDKWQQEFRGRVVKLREEVDALNVRLDRLEE